MDIGDFKLMKPPNWHCEFLIYFCLRRNVLRQLLNQCVCMFSFKQEAIPHRIQQDIITELRTPDRLRETLDVVDIVLGFLSSGGVNPRVKLTKYIDNHQMNKRTFSAKVKLLIAIITLL